MNNHYETVEDYIADVGDVMPERDAVQMAREHGTTLDAYYDDNGTSDTINTHDFLAWLGY